MAKNPVIVPYFDLSLQHAAGSLLRAMRRPGDGERHLDLIGRIRSATSESAMRSSFIVGFPGETEDDVDTLERFLEAAQLDWAGFFAYSAEEGTPAALLPGQVEPDVVAERIRRLQGVQDRVTAERNAAVIGQEFDVVVDLVEDGTPIGRSYREAPEIDGVILLDRGRSGEWLRARITASYGSELAGEVVG